MPTVTPAGKTPAKDKSPDKSAIKAPEKVPAKSATKPAGKPHDKPEKHDKHDQAAEKVSPMTFAPMDFDAFLSKLSPKDRQNIDRHLLAIEESSTKSHAKIWKRLASTMMTLASHSAKANGQQSMQFYIQDGKYRMQIFAMEDLRDGKIHVYATDSLDEALKTGLLAKPKPGDEPGTYRIAGGKETLAAEQLDGKLSNPAPFYKDMLGWNRRALHVTLSTMATDAQAEATEKLLVLGARKAGVK
jgi:hypothetical protein